MRAISPFSPRRTLQFLPSSIPQHSLYLSTISYRHYSLTAVLISRSLINLQEASLRSVKVDSDDPAYISSLSENSLPSFVAAPGTTRPALGSTIEHYIEGGMLDNGETGGADDGEEAAAVGMLPIDVEV